MIAFKTGNTAKIADYSAERNFGRNSLARTYTHTNIYVCVVLNNIENLKHYI